MLLELPLSFFLEILYNLLMDMYYLQGFLHESNILAYKITIINLTVHINMHTIKSLN